MSVATREQLLDMADRMRRLGPGAVQPHRLYFETTEVLRQGGIEFDEVTGLYRHAMIHAGAIIPRDRPRFHACPECDARLDVAEDN